MLKFYYGVMGAGKTTELIKTYEKRDLQIPLLEKKIKKQKNIHDTSIWFHGTYFNFNYIVDVTNKY